MARPTTRNEFKEFCLRRLGKPVIEINVDDDQIEDRIDEAISYYNDYHFDGSEKIYLKHQITSDDVSNGYITVSNNIIGITNIFRIGEESNSSQDIFSLNYQFRLNEVFNLGNYSLINYYAAQQHIGVMQELLVGRQPIRFNRHTNKLYVDMDWNKVGVGRYLIAECYSKLDEETHSDMWADRWLQEYATAKIQENWGRNLTKFEGLQLPGGVQFNGVQILQDAREDIRRLEEDMINSYSLPAADFMG